MKFILGKKLGMTTLYKENKACNVTLLEVPLNIVDKICDLDKEGYFSIRLSLSKTKNVKFSKEFRVESIEGYSLEQSIGIDVFKEGDKVSVFGDRKAKGFQGVVKRHGFAGGPKTHGHRHVLRTPGSIGRSFPEHVVKGTRMAGRMGSERFVSKNLNIVLIDKKNNIMAVEGSVPGVSGRIIEIVA